MLARTMIIIGILAFCPIMPVMAAPTGAPSNSALGPLTTQNPPNGTVKITVPVHMAQIPSGYNSFEVTCSFSLVGQTISYGTVVTTGTENASTTVNLIKGAFDGNVQVTLKQATSAPSSITGYYCFATFNFVPVQGRPLPQFTPQAGAPYVPLVKGSF
jgi:hypothetical protein